MSDELIQEIFEHGYLDREGYCFFCGEYIPTVHDPETGEYNADPDLSKHSEDCLWHEVVAQVEGR